MPTGSGQMEFLRAIVDSVPMAVSVKDRRLRFVFVNEFFSLSHGLEAKDIIGKSSDDLLSQTASAEVRAKDLAVLASGQPSGLWEVDDGWLDCFDGCDCHRLYTFMTSADGDIIEHAYLRWLGRGETVASVVDAAPWRDVGVTPRHYLDANLALASGEIVWPGITSKDGVMSAETARIAATARYPDENEALTAAGATAVFNIYAEAGTGFADHIESFSAEGQPAP